MDLTSDLAPRERGEAEPSPREHPGSRASSITIIAILALFTWPIPRLAPVISLDGSWAAGLHQAVHHGIPHGAGIDFTYGPFGFLDVPKLFYPSTAIAAIVYTVAIHFALIAVVFLATRRTAGVFIATTISLTLATVALVEPAEVVPLVYFAACLACLRYSPSERRIKTIIFAGTFIGAFQLLVKFNTGIVVLALAAAMILSLPRRRPATLALHVIGSGAAVIAFWIIASQPIGSFATWLRNSVGIASGYTSAMATERRPWEYAFVAAALLGIGLLALLARSRMEERTRYAVYELLLILLFTEWKHGFVRHDVHSMGFYFALAVVAIALMWFNAGITPSIVLAMLLMAGVGIAMPHESQTALFRPTKVARTIAIMHSEGRRQAFIAASKLRIMRIVPIDQTTLGFLAGHTVHVDPHQALLAWVYDFDWKPVPIFQTYSAYTPALDRFNARMLAGPDAPDRILRDVRKAIDTRYRMFESPDYILSLLCHYKELSAQKIYEVVGHTAGRCGAERKLGRTQDPNGSVTVPKAAAGEMVIMRVLLKSSAFEQLRSILFKPTAPPGIVIRSANGTQGFRLVEATAGDSLVLCVPGAAGFKAPFVTTVCPDTVRITDRENWSVSFFAVPIR